MSSLAFSVLNSDTLFNAQGQIIDAYRRYESGGEEHGLTEALQLLDTLVSICEKSEEGRAWLERQKRPGKYPRNSWGYVYNKLTEINQGKPR